MPSVQSYRHFTEIFASAMAYTMKSTDGIVTISDRMDITEELVCVYFILISRIVKLSYKTYVYKLVREKGEMEWIIRTNGAGR
jgi:RsiW-degrading membrane proteinase PrsW (M82 family)